MAKVKKQYRASKKAPQRKTLLFASLFALVGLSTISGILLTLNNRQETRTHAQTPSTSFITRSGNQLILDGQPLRITGYNYPWIGNEWCAGPSLSEMDAVFSQIKTASKGNVVRQAWYQAGADDLNFTRFDQQIAEAKKYGLRIIPILVNEWTDCEYSSTMKYLSWYKTGYTQKNDGYPLAFRDYAVKVAQHYANEPTVAWWQLVNEPDGRNPDDSCTESSAATALRNFADDVTGAIKTVDPNHMVDLGSISWCGQQGSNFQYVNAGKVDLCDAYHDYSDATNATVSSHIADCNKINKPSFIGEAGICADVDSNGKCTGTVSSTTLQNRAKFFNNKIQAAFNAGAVGYMIWYKGISSGGWDVGPGDPTEQILAKYAMQQPTPSTGSGPTATPVPTAKPTPVQAAVTRVQSLSARVGTSWKSTVVKYKLQSTGSKKVNLIVAVRKNNSNYDFPMKSNVTLTDTQSFTTKKKFSRGTYTYWVAYYYNGQWVDLSPKKSFKINR